MKFKIQYLIYFVGCFACLSACAEKTKSETNSIIEETAEDYIEDIMKIWPGFYNNDQQISTKENSGDAIWRGDADNGGWLNVHSHYIPYSNPEIGDNLLYVEEYRDNDPALAYRQRIYKLTIDSTGTGRVVMCTFKDKKKYLGAYKDFSILDSLTASDIGPYPPICDLIISKEDGKYRMKMNGKDCAFGDRYFNYDVLLSDKVFAYRDKIMQLSNDSLLTTAADFQWHNLDKIEDR